MAGSIDTYGYDSVIGLAHGLTMTHTDPLGRVWTHASGDGYHGAPAVAIDPLGHRETYIYQYDAWGQPLAFINGLGYRVSFGYSASLLWNSQTDALGNTLQFERLDQLQVSKVTDALGNVTTISYGPYPVSMQVQVITDPLGNTTTFGYQSNGLPQYVQDAKGNRTTFQWSTAGVLTTLTDARGFIWSYVHDSVGNLTELVDPQGSRWTMGYDKMARLQSVQNPLGAIATTLHDVRNLVQAQIDPLGNRTTHQYNSSGNPIETMDALGNRWSTVYDASDQITALIDPLGYRTSFCYDLGGRMTVIQDGLGNRITRIFDEANQLQAQIDPLGNYTTWVYDACGRICCKINALGYRTTSSYDPVGRIGTITNALGQNAQVFYNQAGWPTTFVDALGYTTTIQHDVLGFPRVVIDRRGYRTTYAYDSMRHPVTVLDAQTALWTTMYDELGRVQGGVDPLGFRVTTVFDGAGRRIALIDARGNRWSQSYDARDLLVGSIDPLGQRETLGYDPIDRLVTGLNARNQFATLSYNARGEIIGETYADGSRVTIGLDALGQVVSIVDETGRYTMTYTARGEISAVQAPQHPSGGILTYDYDAVANRILLNSWLGRQTLGYDAVNRNTLLWDVDGNRTTWTFDARHQITRQDNWNGTVATMAYDREGLTTGVRHTSNGGAVLAESYYTWDEVGEPTKRVTGSGTTTWVHDAARQLQAEWHEAGVTATWSYDGAGNRLQQQRLQGGVQTVTGYAYDAASQIVTLTAAGVTTTFAFDATGNMQSEQTVGVGRTTYSWDPRNRLTLVSGPNGPVATYTYRFDNLRAVVDQGEGRVTQVWDVSGPTGYGDLFEEIGPSGLLRGYFRGARLAVQKLETGDLVAGQDYLGSLDLMTDAGQTVTATYQRSAWGEVLALTGAVSAPMGWLGEWGYYRDSAQRTWVRARHQAIGLGRWFSRDPVGFAGGRNLFEYTANDPTLIIDPSGRALELRSSIASYVNRGPRDRYEIRHYSNPAVGVVFQRRALASRLASNDPEYIPLRPAYVDDWTIRYNMRAAAEAFRYAPRKTWFEEHVKYGSPWDYKMADPRLAEKYRGIFSKPATIHGDFEAFGNWHYGAVGFAARLPLEVLLYGAGLAQGHDNPGDVYDGGPGPEWIHFPQSCLFMAGFRSPIPWLVQAPYGDEWWDAYWIVQGYNWAARHAREILGRRAQVEW